MSSAIKVTLPDQSVRELPRPMSVAEFAASIGPGLAKSAVAGKINGTLVDIRTVIDHDAKVEIVTLQNKESVEVIRHSAAHVLAQAVQSLWPDVKVTIGPVIDSGFFYDLDSPRPFAPEDLEKIEKEMAKVVSANYEIKKEVWPVQKAIDTFKKMGERFKVEIIQDLAAKGETEVSIYHQGPWFDLCRGPHVPTTGFIKAFKLTSIAGAYWRGDEKNPMLQRIYGTAFSSKKELDEYLLQLEEAKKRDHRKLGKELNLFTFHQWAPASPFFYPRGTVIYNELVAYCRQLYKKYGYSEVITPQIFDIELFHCSGHTENYKDNMYFTKADEKEYGVKPMNCPGHCLLYGTDKHSYRELPIRMADFGRLHRYERSGVLHGLARVRSFSQDDAHIFCTEDQLEQEIDSFLAMTDEVYKTLGFSEYRIALSTRPEKRMGTDAQWDRAEKILEDGLKKHKIDYTIQPGEGAFYGPKYELQVVDAIKRPWQLATLQLDSNLPERFKLEYQGTDNTAHRPVMLHRAILGSLERFVAVLTEHVAGHFPTWIAPNQVLILNVTEAQEPYCKELHKKFLDAGIRAEMDLRNEKLGFKIREGQLQKSPYMLIIGDKELQNKNISVRHSSGKQFEGLDFEHFLSRLKGEITERKLKSVFIESP